MHIAKHFARWYARCNLNLRRTNGIDHLSSDDETKKNIENLSPVWGALRLLDSSISHIRYPLYPVVHVIYIYRIVIIEKPSTIIEIIVHVIRYHSVRIYNWTFRFRSRSNVRLIGEKKKKKKNRDPLLFLTNKRFRFFYFLRFIISCNISYKRA